MKANNSSSSLLNIRIPKFQQLSPVETTRSETWLHNQYSTESTNKTSSSSNDFSMSDFRPIDLSLPPMHKSTPLSSLSSNIETEMKQKPMKKCTNFTIEHLLASPFRTSTSTNASKQITSIFSKKKTRHFSDNYLHQIIHRRQISKQKSLQRKSSNQPRGSFIRFIFDIFNDLINRTNQMKTHVHSLTNDPLGQLAELACKLDTREQSIQLNEDFVLRKCYLLIRQVYQKYQYKKIRKRLNSNWKYIFKKRFLQLLLSISNYVQMKKIDLLSTTNLVHYHLLTSDINSDKFKDKTKSICSYLKLEDIHSNLQILVPNNGLLCEATVQLIDTTDDLLLVRINHDRQTYLIPKHDLCQLACSNIVPNEVHLLSKGSRVCAHWSTSLRGLHPGIVKRIPQDVDQSSMISLLFDDGDSGLIKLDEIRLLPDNYELKDINFEEWRINSFQIASLFRTNRRSASCASMKTRRNSSSSSSVKRVNKTKSSYSAAAAALPQWTFNSQNSTLCRHDKKQMIHVGDCVVLHGVDRSLSYIGKVLKFYHNKSTKIDMVRLKWFYSPNETRNGIQDNDLPGALYESTHIDENPISTIRSKGTIFKSYDDYVKKTNHGKKRKDTDFYLVGHYNPTTGRLRRYSDK